MRLELDDAQKLLALRSERAAQPFWARPAGAETKGHRRGPLLGAKQEEGGSKMLACLVLWAPALQKESF